jgi:hypothetical protein
MINKYAVALYITLLFAGCTHESRADGFYQGNPVETRKHMYSPEKVALEQAKQNTAKCQQEHPRDYGFACSAVYADGARAGYDYSHFVATGEHAQQYQPKVVVVAKQEFEDFDDKAVRNEFVKFINNDNSLTPAQKAKEISDYDKEHSVPYGKRCMGC